MGEWVLKDTVSFLKLFGQTINGFEVVAIHPDQNLVFLQHFNWELISYNMDSKEMCHLCTLGTSYPSITPYVPYCKGCQHLKISTEIVACGLLTGTFQPKSDFPAVFYRCWLCSRIGCDAFSWCWLCMWST
jgi:hypothetical protein